MIRVVPFLALSMLAAGAWSQAPAAKNTAAGTSVKPSAADLAAMRAQQDLLRRQRTDIDRAEEQGVNTPISAIARFRGTFARTVVGVGLVTGLDGTGDSKSILETQKSNANFLRTLGLDVNVASNGSKNIALVALTCEIPPFSNPGQQLDLKVTSIGDAKSLRNGVLLPTVLRLPGAAPSDDPIASAAGSMSVGGFGVSAGGNSQTRGTVTAGIIPGGATVLNATQTVTLFEGRKMYIDLDQADIMTAQRIEERINSALPGFFARAVDGGCVSVTVPEGMSANAAQAQLVALDVKANTEAKVVVDERTGTIVIGGAVRVAPCAIAQGSLNVRVDEQLFVSQPFPASNGATVAGSQKTLTTNEETAQIAMLRPNTTVSDLASIFQALQLRPGDIIAILENLRSHGALKARLVIQ